MVFGGKGGIEMPKCKLCGQKKEFYHELGYCDECLDEIRAFLKTSKQRLHAWKEESLEASEERRAEIGAQALALEEALRQYEKRGVALNRKEYRALLRAVYAHCGVARPKKKQKPLVIGMGAACAALAALSIVFAVQWQQEKAAGEELRMQNEQLSMTVSDLQMQLDGSQVSPEGGDTAGIPEGDGWRIRGECCGRRGLSVRWHGCCHWRRGSAGRWDCYFRVTGTRSKLDIPKKLKIISFCFHVPFALPLSGSAVHCS